MKEKVLHISAIIPDELYVKRDADRKLQDVIKRMSKPAYISVARQMGKTNLLIHTKTELEDENNRYVFIDITNQFKTSQDCFRYIIDQVIDANEDILEFKEAGEFIRKNRKRVTDNPTKEYQDELREILKRYKGNLVIFLDEVDDLRKHHFSDEVFAQIRKTYFLRVTYPIFNRLSYVLSGVIDPEKLIKNKDNSPFNIAIPIYLNDFTKEEMNQLIKNSGVEISEEVKWHLYDWLSGNPRMTFDTLSKIEDEYLEGKIVTKDTVDVIIRETYLKSFKNPPVDHIRDMVKRNSDLRKSVVKVKRQQLAELSDDEKNKLYLYGIINADFKKESVFIKNKVLDFALSTEWLKQVELETKGYYELGKEKIEQGAFDEGIFYLKEYIKNSPGGPFFNLSKYAVGEAYYFQRKHEQSNAFLLARPITKDRSPEIYFTQLLYIGINYTSLQRQREALEIYDEMLNDSPPAEQFVHALANKAEVHLSEKNIPNAELISLYKRALDSLKDLEPRSLEKTYFLTLIYFRLGHLHLNENDKEKAVLYLNEALKFARDTEKPVILLNIDLCIKEDVEKRKVLYDEVAELIISKNLHFTSEENNLPFGPLLIWIVLVNLYDFGSLKFQELFDFSLKELFENSKTRDALLFDVGVFAFNSNDPQVGNALFQMILDSQENDLESKMLAYQVLGLRNVQVDPKRAILYLTRYVELFDAFDNFNKEITTTDLTAFVQLIVMFRDSNEMVRSFSVAQTIEKKFREDWSYEIKGQAVIVLFFIMDFYNYSGDLEKTLEYGSRTLQIINEIRPVLKETTYVNKNVIEQLEHETIKIVNESSKIRSSIQPVRIIRERGRNEWVQVRYKNGNTVYGKYKRLKNDIDNGTCIIID